MNKKQDEESDSFIQRYLKELKVRFWHTGPDGMGFVFSDRDSDQAKPEDEEDGKG